MAITHYLLEACPSQIGSWHVVEERVLIGESMTCVITLTLDASSKHILPLNIKPNDVLENAQAVVLFWYGGWRYERPQRRRGFGIHLTGGYEVMAGSSDGLVSRDRVAAAKSQKDLDDM